MGPREKDVSDNSGQHKTPDVDTSHVSEGGGDASNKSERSHDTGVGRHEEGCHV